MAIIKNLIGKFRDNYCWTFHLHRVVEENFVDFRIYSFLRSPVVKSMRHLRKAGVNTLMVTVRNWAWYSYLPRLWVKTRLRRLEDRGIILELRRAL